MFSKKLLMKSEPDEDIMGIPRYTVDANGNATRLTALSESAFNKVKEIEVEGLSYEFYAGGLTGSVSFPKLTRVDENGLDHTFFYCINLNESVSFPELTTVDMYGMNYAFARCESLQSISFPKLTTIEYMGLYYVCWRNLLMTGTVSFPELITIGSHGMDYAFYQCPNITSISFPKLTTIGESNQYAGLAYAFSGCSELTGSISFPELTNIYGSKSTGFGTSIGAFYYTFQSCSKITSVSFPKLATITDKYAFQNAFSGCTGLTGIHFNASSRSTIESLNGYSSKFGASNATIYFDL